LFFVIVVVIVFLCVLKK